MKFGYIILDFIWRFLLKMSAGTGRNIRHLPCVSRRTGETGVCMFAFTCAKANGTHLGTCIDRFYFGSCCKIDEEPDIFPQDNSIDDGSPARPFVTTHGPIESNDIPEYFSRPKPINEKKPTGTYSTEVSYGFEYTYQDLASFSRSPQQRWIQSYRSFPKNESFFSIFLYKL